MTTVAAGIRALLSGARTVAGMVKKVESSEALQARFDDSSAQVNRETGQVAYAVCKALVAHSLGREPSDDEVNDFLSAGVDDPAFPARAHRLMGEARKAASQRRRAFLASVLFGLPFSKIPDDERDRVDMVVERMTVEDAELLLLIADERTTPPSVVKNQFGPLGIAVLTYADLQADRPTVLFSTPDPSQRTDGLSRSVNRAVFASLTLLGCVELGRALPKKGQWYPHHLLVTPLGEMVIKAIVEVRPGLDARM